MQLNVAAHAWNAGRCRGTLCAQAEHCRDRRSANSRLLGPAAEGAVVPCGPEEAAVCLTAARHAPQPASAARPQLRRCRPPSTGMLAPVRKAARSEHRKAASSPISRGWPQRCAGVAAISRCFTSSGADSCSVEAQGTGTRRGQGVDGRCASDDSPRGALSLAWERGGTCSSQPTAC